MNRPRISAVTVNYNGVAWNDACLDSLAKESLLSRIVFVDNASTDGSLASARRRYAGDGRFSFLAQATNLFFARGCNRGIEAALAQGADYIFLLNNDAVLEPGCLAALLSFLSGRADAAAVQPLLVRSDAPQTVASGGCCVAFSGLAWDMSAGMDTDALPDTPYAVAGVTGGAALWRAEALRRVGLFDEAFGMYFEDVDLSLRGREQGWGFFAVPQARVRHACGATSERFAPSHLCARLCVRNAVRLICKHWPAMWLVPALAGWLGVSVLMCAANINAGKFAYSGAVAKGLLHGLALMPALLIRRLRRRDTINAAVLRRWIEKRLVPPHA